MEDDLIRPRRTVHPINRHTNDRLGHQTRLTFYFKNRILFRFLCRDGS
jgi:hypothetical protein